MELIIQIYGEKISCNHAERGADYIKVYFNGKLIREDNGISDFSGYSLTDENGNPVEFSTPNEEESQMDTAIRAVVMAMTETGSISAPLAETVMNRAMEIAHE